MLGILDVLKRRVALIFRSPAGILVFCVGIFAFSYVAKTVIRLLEDDVQEGEEYFIEDEDYLLERISQFKAGESPSDGESHGEFSTDEAKLNGKSVDQEFWQEVTDANDEMHVYSAYYDVNFRLIRMIAVANKFMSQSLECRFANDDATVIGTTAAEIKFIREAKEFPFSAAFVLCVLPSGYDRSGYKPPKFVSVASTRFSHVSPTSNILEIQYPSAQPSIKFAVCVQPIFWGYDDVTKFVEWIEFHRSLGVERFTFYNISIGPTVGCVLEEYNSLSLYDGDGESGIYIEVLPWGDPSDRIKSNVTIKQQMQMAALNDCVYRQRGFAQYVFNIDLDEFITPHKDKDLNYEDLIARLDLLSGRRRVGLYEFRNAFFSPTYKITDASETEAIELKEDEKVKAEVTPDFQETEDFESDVLRSNVISSLVTLKDTVRMAEPHSNDYRTKYICIPNRLVEAGIHNTWEMAKGYGTLNVPPTIGLLHHYRIYESVPITVEDFAAKNLSINYDIPSKVFETLYALKDTCNIWKTKTK